MPLNRSRLLTVALTAVILASGAPQEPEAGPQAAASAILSGTWRPSLAPGVSAAVMRHGILVFSGAFGIADLDNSVPTSPNTVYNIGSVSKVMTAVAVMQLVEQGRVGLDDPIQKYVPSFPVKRGPITIRHLLTHTSGIRHYLKTDFPLAPDNENWRPYRSFADAIGIFGGDPLLFQPGAYRSYASYGVNLLQGVVEVASGQAFEAYLREHVWSPAGMAATQFDIPERVVPHRARGYARIGKEFVNAGYGDLTYKFASGGMLSTVLDLVRFGAALNHDKLMSASTRQVMLSPQTTSLLYRAKGPPARADFTQGFLWRIGADEKGRRYAYHCGAVKEFAACLVDYTDEDLVVAFAANGDAGGYRNTAALADPFRTR